MKRDWSFQLFLVHKCICDFLILYLYAKRLMIDSFSGDFFGKLIQKAGVVFAKEINI